MSYDVQQIKQAAAGRWPEIISRLGGVDEQSLDGKHRPCPKCGGTDRFRFFADDAGGAICNQCFNHENSDGIATLRWLCGCDFPTALGMLASDLGIDAEPSRNGRTVDVVAAVAREKRMPLEAFRAFGAKPATRGRLPVARVPVYDDKGEQHSHFDLAPGQGKGWSKAGKGSAGLFFPGRLPQPGESWLLVEGVKDAAALFGLGFLAAGLPSKELPAKFARLFRGADVTLVADRDVGGEDGAQKSAARLHGVTASVHIATLPGEIKPAGGDDVRDVLAKPDGERLVRQAIEDAAEWEPPADDATNAERPVTNAVVDDKKVVPAPMTDILAALRRRSDDWPRRVDDRLFAYDTGGIHWLGSAAALFGWLASVSGRIFWHRPVGCVTKEEFFHELRRTSRRYDAVVDMPHEPPMAGHFYTCGIPEPGDGATLRELLDRYQPATPIDADLMKAALMTLAWGGPPGTRPCFVITSDDGRGVGKTVFATTVCQVFGGATSISHKEDIGKIKTRLLSLDSLTKRAAVLDNVKTLKFSWDDLEALITAPVIGGHRMYVGEGERPNVLTWFITLNGPSLSTDMAQRAVIIKVKRPPRSGAWHEETVRFIDQNRERIIADLIGCLQIKPVKLQNFTRWATWERYVLARLPEPSDAQAVIRERQGDVDADAEGADITESFFGRQLRKLSYNVDTQIIFIPSETAARWAGWAHNEKVGTVAACRTIKQAIHEKRIQRLRTSRCNSMGRGFVWHGLDAEPSETTFVDILERLANRASEKTGYHVT